MEHHAEQPLSYLLNWLWELKVINDEDQQEYSERGTKAFFDELRNGYILGKLALIAVPQYASSYRMDLCTSAVTRYR